MHIVICSYMHVLVICIAMISFKGIQNGSPWKGNRNLTHGDTAPNSALKWFLPFFGLCWFISPLHNVINWKVFLT